jgi:quinol monooxygenase YgiN
MIQSTIRLVLAPEKEDEVQQILQSLVERIRAEAGRQECSIYKDTRKAHTINFVEFWLSEEDLQRHLRSIEYHKVLLAMEIGIEPPEIRFDTVTSTRGVETIEKARTNEGGCNQ